MVDTKKIGFVAYKNQKKKHCLTRYVFFYLYRCAGHNQLLPIYKKNTKTMAQNPVGIYGSKKTKLVEREK